MSYSAKKEVSARFAGNQELSGVINKLLQAHEREMRARLLVEMPRTQPVPSGIHAQNLRALENYADLRQAAVVELCDTIRDQVLAIITDAFDRRTPATLDARTFR